MSENTPHMPKFGTSARIDKWLWAARVYKTRSMAVDAIKNSRVTIDGTAVKPSHIIKEGDVVSVRKPPVTYSFKVIACIETRVGAKLLPQVYENVTPAEEYEKLDNAARGAPRRKSAASSMPSPTRSCSGGTTIRHCKGGPCGRPQMHCIRPARKKFEKYTT